ncbi:MAG: hypothetical protein IKX25_10775 [Bacteroidales bacterium]|nr:hypothetical protein [Bacteroidales bacterium]
MGKTVFDSKFCIINYLGSGANIQRKKICCAKKQEKNEGKLEKSLPSFKK